MWLISNKSWAALAIGAAFAAPAAADLSAADLAKLGTTLTPVGAEKAGNAAGTIPAWDGGITKPTAGLQAGRALSRSVRLATSRSSPSTQELRALQGRARARPDRDVQDLPGLQDDRLPDAPQRRRSPHATTRRRSNAPPRRSSRPAATAWSAAWAAFPFPIPKNGIEAIWNHGAALLAATRSRRTGRRPRSRPPGTTRW